MRMSNVISSNCLIALSLFVVCVFYFIRGEKKNKTDVQKAKNFQNFSSVFVSLFKGI